MDRSLCILLPVHNQQASLVPQVVGVLDVAAELTTRFEIFVVDDASTDATFELAVDVARVYPQVAVLRHGQRQGTTRTVEMGLNHTSAEIVVVRDPTDSQHDATQLVRLWTLATRPFGESFAHMTGTVRQGSGRRGFSLSMTRLAQQAASLRQNELESSFGGFRLCRPRLRDATERRFEFDSAEPRTVAKPLQSAARHRIARIRHLLAHD